MVTSRRESATASDFQNRQRQGHKSYHFLINVGCVVGLSRGLRQGPRRPPCPRHATAPAVGLKPPSMPPPCHRQVPGAVLGKKEKRTRCLHPMFRPLHALNPQSPPAARTPRPPVRHTTRPSSPWRSMSFCTSFSSPRPCCWPPDGAQTTPTSPARTARRRARWCSRPGRRCRRWCISRSRRAGSSLGITIGFGRRRTKGWPRYFIFILFLTSTLSLAKVRSKRPYSTPATMTPSTLTPSTLNPSTLTPSTPSTHFISDTTVPPPP